MVGNGDARGGPVDPFAVEQRLPVFIGLQAERQCTLAFLFEFFGARPRRAERGQEGNQSNRDRAYSEMPAHLLPHSPTALAPRHRTDPEACRAFGPVGGRALRADRAGGDADLGSA